MSKPTINLFSGTNGEGAALMSELDVRHEKYNKADVVAITKSSSGNIVWLEKGHLGEQPSGLAHIIDSHGSDFQNQNISNDEIPQYIMTAVQYGTIVEYQGRGSGRPIYEFEYDHIKRRIAITIGSNGYIVGANPRPTPKEELP